MIQLPYRPRMGQALVLALSAALVTATCPAMATAAAFHHTSVTRYGEVGCCEFLEEGPAPVQLEATQVGHEGGWYSFAASAAPGNLMTWSQNNRVNDTGINIRKDINARSSFDDLMFTDGTGVPKPVTFWVHVEVSGGAQVSYWEGYNSGCLFGSLAVQASPTNGPAYYLGGWEQIGPEFTCPYPSDGFFAGESGAQLAKSLRVGPFVVNSEQPIQLELRSTIMASPVVGSGEPPTMVTGHLFASLSQLTAAIESPGFDANSAQAQIVNNVVTALVSVAPSAAADLRLSQSVPNPARAGATIAFELPRNGDARLALFDVAGREVRRLAEGWHPAGAHSVRWDGRDASGRSVPPGIYLYRLRTAGEVRTRSMVVTR